MGRIDSTPSPDDLPGPTVVESVTTPGGADPDTGEHDAYSVRNDVSSERPLRSWTGPPPDEDDLVGTTLCNTYSIVRVIGEGGMGRVYEARHTRIAGKRYAIKTLHPEFLRQREVITRFQREAEAAASISNPHVVGVYDVDRAPDGSPFIVAEYLEGEELGDLLERVGKLEVGRAVRIVRQVCKALGAAHDIGIVHRDVKPENVFLTGDPSEPLAKVLDFGISRLATEGGGASLTKTGMVMGTPAYMSPEQARGERVDHRTDIYGVGAILYTALTGTVPFEREDAAATVVAVLTQEPPRPRSIEPAIPEGLEFVIQKAMAREPDSRYESMGELFEALAPHDPREKALAASAPLKVTHTMAEQDVRDARGLLVVLVVASLLTLVIGLVTTAAALMRLAGLALTPLEITLLLVGGASGLITPTLLIIRHLRRHAWNNSLKTVQLVHALRRPLLVGGCTYGFSALLVHLVDNVLLRASPGVAWPAWDVLLFAASIGAALVVAWLDKRRRHKPEAASERPIALALALSGAVLATALVPTMLRQRDHASAEGPTASVTESEAPAESTQAPILTTRDRATTAELEKAIGEGVEALRALSERFPRDAVVLEARMLAEAATPGGLPTAVKTAIALLELDQDARDDAKLHKVLVDALDAGEHASALALDVMAHKLGSAGPDLLYEVSETNAAQKTRADELLAEAAVRKLATPALSIALDLRAAEGCGAKVALLDRAAKEGDDRSVKILRPLTVGKRRGCGFLGLSACAAPCGKDARAILRAIEAIEGRAATKPAAR